MSLFRLCLNCHRGQQGATICEWLIKEFYAKYGIPKEMVVDWIENNDLLLLLMNWAGSDWNSERLGSRRLIAFGRNTGLHPRCV